MEEYVKKLNLESDTFAEMKRDFDFVLQRLLGNMEEKKSTDGSLTLKIDVSFVKEFIPNYDPDVEGESREISKPRFKHKITSAVQIKDEKSGNLDTEMELVFDEDTGEYVMKPIANTEQRTIFDKDFQDNMETEEPEEEKPKGIPQLPGPADDAVIDADFTETEPDDTETGADDTAEDDIEDVTDEILGDGDDSGDDDEPEDYDYDEPEDE